MLLAATVNGAIANPEEHKAEKDYTIDMDFSNALGKPAVTLTMNLKSLAYVSKLLIAGRTATVIAEARKDKPFHD